MCLHKLSELPHDSLHQNLTDLTSLGLNSTKDTCDYISLDDIKDVVSTKNDLLVIQLNIRGILSKQSSLSNLISECTRDTKIDVVILCET